MKKVDLLFNNGIYDLICPLLKLTKNPQQLLDTT